MKKLKLISSIACAAIVVAIAGQELPGIDVAATEDLTPTSILKMQSSPISTLRANPKTDSSDDIFFEDFESATGEAPYDMPEGWSVTPTPGHSESTWNAGALADDESVIAGVSGYKYAISLYPEGYSAAAWAISPSFHLDDTEKFDLYFYYYLPQHPNTSKCGSFEVYIIDSDGNIESKVFTSSTTGVKGWTLARRTFYCSEGDYRIGFKCTTPDGGYVVAIDDIELRPAGPSIYGVGTDGVMSIVDFGTVDQFSESQQEVSITNMGGEAVELSLKSAPDYIKVSGLPTSITAWGEITLTLDGTKVNQTGVIEDEVVVTTNDPNCPELHIPIKATITTPTLTGYYNEEFENGNPEGWTVSGDWFCYPNRGVNNSRCMGVWTIFPSPLITHFVEMGDDPILAFDYKVREYSTVTPESQCQPTRPEYVKFRVYVSTDYGKTWKQVYAILPEDGDMKHVLSYDYATVVIDMSEYAGKTCQFKFQHDTMYFGQGDSFFTLDNVKIGTPIADDLQADALYGPAALVAGEEASVSARVRNLGYKAAEPFSIDLMDEAGNVLTTQTCESLSPSSNQIFNLKWTPANTGATTLTAKVRASKDEVSSNDISYPLPIYTHEKAPLNIELGKMYQRSDTTSVFPLCYYFSDSKTQTIYPANMVGYNDATITALTYRMKSYSEKWSVPVHFRIGETDKADFSDGVMIDESQMVEVVASPYYLPGGDNELTFAFSQPYHYKGGNLVIQAEKSMNEFWEDCFFVCNQRPNCTISLLDKSSLYNSDLTPQAYNDSPALKLSLTANPAGIVSGVVKDTEDQLIKDAEITLGGTNRTTTTSADGSFIFKNVGVGEYLLNVSAYGYEVVDSETVSVAEGQTTNVTITIAKRARKTISGSVTDANGSPIAGARVKALGYSNMIAYTDADGKYTIADVILSGTDTYNFNVSAPYYHDYELTNAELIGHNFVLTPVASPLQQVNAKSESNGINISWDVPEHEFRYDNCGEPFSQIGYRDYGSKAIIGSVHRRVANVTDIQWFLTEEGAPHSTVNLFLIDLDPDGEPSTRVLYTTTVDSEDMQWNTYHLPNAINCPNGFLLALSVPTGYHGIGKTDVSEEYPQQARLHYASEDYTYDPGVGVRAGNYRDISLAYPEPYHLMLRALGEDLGAVDYTSYLNSAEKTTEGIDIPSYSFEVCRLTADEETSLGTTSELSFLDEHPAEQPCRYIVYVNYVGVNSRGCPSNEVEWSGINNVSSDNDVVTVYDLNGFCIINKGSRADLLNIPAGIYIINGKKAILK